MFDKAFPIDSVPCIETIDPQTIAFDVDGVVADTMTLFIDIAKSEFGIDSLVYDDIKSYSLDECLDMDPEIMKTIVQKLLDGDYRQPLRPIDGAGRVLSRLGCEFGRVLFVTARPYPGPISGWLLENLDIEGSKVEVVATGSFEAKSEVLLKQGISFFVEDRLETCYLLKEVGIVPILFRQPWNRDNDRFAEVGSWRELESMIRFT